MPPLPRDIKQPKSSQNSGSLAQLVEQLTFNQLVAGSNPARPTNVKKRPKGAFLLFRHLSISILDPDDILRACCVNNFTSEE